ncbi:MAG TPA: HEAT repeat domain-containing protein, partial [Planctomycetota bacterium]|nr:HEAT repeat domain-containing protein [Planctomycetota bacterium]
MRSALLLLLLFAQDAAPPPDDNAVRERILKLVEFLEGVLPDTKTKAAAELRDLPIRFAPYLRELAAAHKNADVRAVLDPLAIPAPWTEFLRGSIGESAALIEALRGPESAARRKAVVKTLYLLSDRPEADIQDWAALLLKDTNRGFRDFALHMFKHWPSESTEFLRVLLRDPELGHRAAEALISAGDEGAVATALEQYLSFEKHQSYAGTSLLLAFGVEEADAGKIVDLFRQAKGSIHTGPPILGRRGGRKGIDALSDLCRDGNPRTTPSAMEVVAWMMGDEALPLIRSWRDAFPAELQDRARIPIFLRDPAGALASLEALGPEPTVTALMEFRNNGWIAGPALREPILARLRDRTTRLGVRREMITALGVAGTAEDLPLVVESLADARLADAAAMALAMVGDRRQGKALMRAFLQSQQSLGLVMALVALDVDGPEDDLVEILSDPDGYGFQAVLAIRLAGRNLTPRLKDLILEKYPKWNEFLQRGTEQMVLDPGRRGDDDLVKRLQSSADPGLSSLGDHLAMVNGDASRAPGAAKGARIKGLARHAQLGGFRLDLGAPAGEAWTEAVAAEWDKFRDWHEATAWLAARGRKDAMDRLNDRRAKEPEKVTPAMLTALASGGDAAQLEKLWERAFNAGLTMDDCEVLLGLARRGDAPTKSRILALARGEQASSWGPGHYLAARLALPEALPAFRLAVTRCDQGYHGGARPFDLAACIRALAVLKDAATIPAIRRHVRSGNEVVRIAAMDALADLGDRGAVAGIVRFIDDPTDTRRQLASGWSQESPPIRRVWHHAMEALEKITGEKPPADTVLQRRSFWRA